jgi:hypothetical protein
MNRRERGKGKCSGKTIDYGQIVHTPQTPQFSDMVKIFLNRHKHKLYLPKLTKAIKVHKTTSIHHQKTNLTQNVYAGYAQFQSQPGHWISEGFVSFLLGKCRFHHKSFTIIMCYSRHEHPVP